ncbi:MAG: hypothetical protein WBW55_11225 [Desulfobaccales bacterium]
MNNDRNQHANSGGEEQKSNKYWKYFIIFVDNSWAKFVSWVTDNDKFMAAISVLVIAAFTVALFIATWLLWYSGEQHSERQLRAYALIDKITITNIANPLPSEIKKTYQATGAEITNPVMGPHINIEIKNSGQTPVYKLEGWADTKILEYPLKSHDIIKPIQPKAISIIGRDAVRNLNIANEKPLTESEIKSLRDNSKAIYIYGEITYIDIFTKVHHTKFIYYHNGTVGPIGICIAAAVLEEDAD